MPTEPQQSILYRELSKVAAKEVIEIASPLLVELVNNGTHVLLRCASSISGKLDEHIALLALYRHILEMTDGIEVLVSESCPIPAIPLLRSSFEALLSIEYILEEDYTRRSLSWIVGHIHRRLDMYERCDPSTTKGAQFRKVHSQDKIACQVELPSPEEVAEPRASLLSLLDEPEFKPIEEERSSCDRKIWYALFGGPRTLEKLAQHLRRGAQYDILYRQWSTMSHAQDLLPFLGKAGDGKFTIGRLRELNGLKVVASHAAAFALEATRLVLDQLHAGEELAYARWYRREIQSNYQLISSSSR
jgi:hypothetical protein